MKALESQHLHQTSQTDAVPYTSPFYKLVDCLKKKVKMGRLAKKVIRWFNENKDLAQFQYRFTGQDSFVPAEFHVYH